MLPITSDLKRGLALSDRRGTLVSERREMTSTKAAGATAVITVALLLSACSSANSPEASADAEGQPVAGGDLVVAVSAYPVCLDIAQHPFQSIVQNQTVETLLDYDRDTLETIPWLATAVTPNDDATVFTITLRDDVTFSNGEPLDAQVVADNFDSVIELGELGKSSQGAAYLDGYVEAVVVSEHELTVTFDAPNAGFPQSLTQRPLGIVAPETLAQTPEDRCSDGVIGTSPWVIDEIVPNESVTFAGRDDYSWASANAQNQGAPYLDTLTFQVVAESSVRTGSLQSGDVDVILTPNAQDLAVLEAEGKTVLETVPGGAVSSLLLNVNEGGPEALKDERVRRALLLAADREQLAANEATYNRVSSIVTSGTPGYTDLSDELVRDVDAANELLDEAGWELDEDEGVRYKDGQPLVIQANVSDTITAPGDTLEILQQNYLEIGVRFDIDQLTSAAWGELYAAVTWQTFPSSLGAPFQNVLVSFYHPDYSIWFKDHDVDPELVALIEEQSATIDTEQRNAIVAEIQQRAIEKAYVVPLLEQTGTIVTGENVHDVAFQPGASGGLFADAWKS